MEEQEEGRLVVLEVLVDLGGFFGEGVEQAVDVAEEDLLVGGKGGEVAE